jgi:DNA-binding CsgD family transcriptional regulator
MKDDGPPTSYFSKAARWYYFISVVSFSVCLFLNQPVYLKNNWWLLLIADWVSVLFIYITLFLYLKGKFNLKLAAASYVYTTFVNISISTWFYFYFDVAFAWNFLFTTFIYCINITVAGFCVGRKHLFIAAGLFWVAFVPLIVVSRNPFLTQNAIAIFFLVLAFSFAVSGFMHVLEKTFQEYTKLREQIHEKDTALIKEQSIRLNFELECKQKEIITKTLYLMDYAEKNQSFLQKLRSLKEKLKNSEQQELNAIIQECQNYHQENYWKEFEINFLGVNPDFHKKLLLLCPALTINDLHLAALVLLGLSTKQIAQLNSNTPESIDVARSRLRTKLNLSTETNLKTFLMQL